MEQSELANQSTADLVRLATEQMRDLVRDEIALAKSEMAEKGKQVGVGAGMLGAAAVLAFYGVGVLLAAVTLALALVLPGWAAALIVAAAVFAVAAGLGMLGRGHLRRGVPAAPEGAIRNVRADLDAVSSAFRHPATMKLAATQGAGTQGAGTQGAGMQPAGMQPAAMRPAAMRNERHA